MQANLNSNAPQTLDAGEESLAILYRPPLLLYASLIVIYLAMRFVVFPEQWPTRQALQLETLWAAVGAIVLILSSFAISRANHATQFKQRNSVRLWLLLTLVLGTAFGITQANELRRRWQSNLVPKPLSNSLHDQADLYFLSAVQQRLIQLATEINTDKVRQNQLLQQLESAPSETLVNRTRLEGELRRLQANEPVRTEHLAIVNRLLASETRWTSSVVATTDDLQTQRMAIEALAYDILPHSSFAASHERFREFEAKQLKELQSSAETELLSAETSAKENSQPIKGLLSDVAEVKAAKQELESKLKSHLRQRMIDEDLDEPPEDDDPKRVALERQLAEVQQQLDERNAKLSAAAKLVTDAEDAASRLSEELSNLSARQAIIAELDGAGVGLNQQFPWLRLPVCIPSGWAWAWTYFLFTTRHAVNLIYLLIVLLAWAIVPSRMNLTDVPSLVLAWHTMVIVWSIFFVLIYLI